MARALHSGQVAHLIPSRSLQNLQLTFPLVCHTIWECSHYCQFTSGDGDTTASLASKQWTAFQVATHSQLSVAVSPPFLTPYPPFLPTTPALLGPLHLPLCYSCFARDILCRNGSTSLRPCLSASSTRRKASFRTARRFLHSACTQFRESSVCLHFPLRGWCLCFPSLHNLRASDDAPAQASFVCHVVLVCLHPVGLPYE